MTSPSSQKKTLLLTGVGPGTGLAIAKKFTAEGYQVAMIARLEERLKGYEAEITGSRAYPCDVADADALLATIAQVKADMGAPNVVIHNAVGGSFGNFLEEKPEVLETNFKINTMALYHLAQTCVPDMVEAGHGAILATGNTSAFRGKERFAAFAPTKAAQRILLESIARTVGPQGVHAAYVAIDAVIDVFWARDAFPDKGDDFFAKPDDIAGEVYHIAHQPKSTWSFEHTIRPFGENW